MRSLAFRLAYDGTGLRGFQKQKDPSLSTVQGLLEDLLGRVLDEPVLVVCAGRTDAGVHALDQVVHVHTSSPRPLDVVVRAVNDLARGRIGIHHAWEAPTWFHARHQASRRVYQYHVHCQRAPSPLLARWSWHVRHPLDLALMQAETWSLLGRRDFRAYHSKGFDLRHFFRTVHRFDVREVPPARGEAGGEHGSWLVQEPSSQHLLVAEIEADAFLPHMVRLMMGTVVDVGSGRRPPGTVAAVLRSRDPRSASTPAPPHGLCLVRVTYPAWCLVPPTPEGRAQEEPTP